MLYSLLCIEIKFPFFGYCVYWYWMKGSIMESQTNAMSRRIFLRRAGSAMLVVSGALAGESHTSVPDNPLQSDRKIRIGVVGGGFGCSFQWHEHPNCTVYAVSDLRTDRRNRLMQVYKCDRAYESLEKLILDENIEAVAVFTGAPDHVRHCAMVMDAGKHVISAVPAAMSIEECEQLLDAKLRTGRTYMMGEQSYFQYYTTGAREVLHEGRFGKLVESAVKY